MAKAKPVPLTAEKVRAIKEHAYAEAVQLYRDSQAAHDASPETRRPLSLRQIVARYPGLMNLASLGRRVNLHNSKMDDAYERTLFRREEEQLIAAYSVEMAARGISLDHKTLTEVANAILKERCLREGTPFKHIGVGWSYRFIKRNPEVKGCWTRGLEASRAGGVNEIVLTKWNGLRDDVMAGVHTAGDTMILPGNIYNMDESSWIPALHQKRRVVGKSGVKIQYEVRSGLRENVTIVATICADGTALRPIVILKGQKILSRWGGGNPEHNIAKAYVSPQPKAWINTVVVREWIERVDNETREKANGAWRVIYFDGHSTHVSYETLLYAREHRIILIILPPHTSHALQPLDLTVFSPLKRALNEEALAHERSTGLGVDKDMVLLILGRAWKRSVSENNIRAGFRLAGIWPHDHKVLTDALVAPSKTTSTLADAPVPMQTLVKVVAREFFKGPTLAAPDFGEVLVTDPKTLEPVDFPPLPCTTSLPAPIPGVESIVASTSTSPMSVENDGDSPEPSASLSPLSSEPEPLPASSPMTTRARRIAGVTREALCGTVYEKIATGEPAKGSDPLPPRIECTKSPMRQPDFCVLDRLNGVGMLSKAELVTLTKDLGLELDLARIQMTTLNKNLDAYAAANVIATIHAKHMQTSLLAKEEKKKRKTTNLPLKPDGSKGQVASCEEMFQYEKARRDELAREEEGKTTRAAARVVRRDELVVLDAAKKKDRDEKAVLNKAKKERKDAEALARKMRREVAEKQNKALDAAHAEAVLKYEAKKRAGGTRLGRMPAKPKKVVVHRRPLSDDEIQVALSVLRSSQRMEAGTGVDEQNDEWEDDEDPPREQANSGADDDGNRANDIGSDSEEDINLSGVADTTEEDTDSEEEDDW